MNAVAALEAALLLAFIAICASRPRHPLAVPARPGPTPADRLDADLRLRRLDHGPTTEATPCAVRIAPPTDETVALQVFWVGDTMLADLEPADVVTLRAWSQGALVGSFGDVRRDHDTWPRDPAAGWEILLVSRAGRLLHLVGRAEAGIDAEIARLTDRLQAARVADVA